MCARVCVLRVCARALVGACARALEGWAGGSAGGGDRGGGGGGEAGAVTRPVETAPSSAEKPSELYLWVWVWICDALV